MGTRRRRLAVLPDTWTYLETSFPALFLGHLVLCGQTQLCRGCHWSVGSVSLGMKNLPGMGNKFRPGQKSLAEFKSLGDSAEDPLPPLCSRKGATTLWSSPLPSGLRKGMCLNLTSKAKQIVWITKALGSIPSTINQSINQSISYHQSIKLVNKLCTSVPLSGFLLHHSKI